MHSANEMTCFLQRVLCKFLHPYSAQFVHCANHQGLFVRHIIHYLGAGAGIWVLEHNVGSLRQPCFCGCLCYSYNRMFFFSSSLWCVAQSLVKHFHDSSVLFFFQYQIQ